MFNTKLTPHSKEAQVAIDTVNAMFKPDKFDLERKNLNEFRKISNIKDDKTAWDKSYENIVAKETPYMVVELLEGIVINHLQRIEAILDVDANYALIPDRFGNTAMSLAMKLEKGLIVNLIKRKLSIQLNGKSKIEM